MDYTYPAKKLLTYGSCKEMTRWPDYLKLGLTHEHVPELIRMVKDRELLWADQNSLAVWV